MLQDEVGQKLRSDAKKKSFLYRLINYAYDVVYLKGVPAKAFKPAPKVRSCLVELRIKDEELKIKWDDLIQFLELFAPFSRKTLGAIRKMIQKKSGCPFVIPESLQKKRLEELDWEQL
jgi:16S rRNA A1518/A1519 N6-dimethyltransferase RsmA/KsgA/DIM1 with predicted DNA glycosylase/AP lyase activity